MTGPAVLPPPQPPREDQALRNVVLLCAAVTALWIGGVAAMYWIFPDWSTRGQVGDTFGAINALFSGLAFAGVIYALHLQRRDLFSQREEMLEARRISEEQLNEMRSAREIQGQPLAIPTNLTFAIEQPRFFYTPPEDRYGAQSRYHVALALDNPTQFPALNVHVSCRLQVVEPSTVLRTADFFTSIVPASLGVGSTNDTLSFMFPTDTSAKIFDAIKVIHAWYR